MFDSVNKVDYTFTQSEKRLVTNKENTLPKTIGGDTGVAENEQLNNLNKETENTTNYLTADNNLQKTDNSQAQSQIKKTFGDEEEKEEYGYSINDDDDEDEEGFFYDGKVSTITSSFDSLAAAVGACDDKISKYQLIAYLQALASDAKIGPDYNSEISFVKNLIAKFDTISDGGDYITSFNGVDTSELYSDEELGEVLSTIELCA